MTDDNRFEKILCPVVFDDNSAAAVRLASRVEPERALYLLHVIPEGHQPGFEDYPPTKELAHECLDNFAREHLSDEIERELLVRRGDPAETIVDTANELGIDLIVMATHGRKGIARLVLGSVTERVLRTARQPVLTLRPEVSVQPGSV